MSKRQDQSRITLDGDPVSAVEWYEKTIAEARKHSPTVLNTNLTLKGEFSPAEVGKALRAVGTNATGAITVTVQFDADSEVTMYAPSSQEDMFEGDEPTEESEGTN